MAHQHSVLEVVAAQFNQQLVESQVVLVVTAAAVQVLLTKQVIKVSMV
jgi:hypothetical protein